MIPQAPEFEKSTPHSRLQALSKLSRDIGFNGLEDLVWEITGKSEEHSAGLAEKIVNNEELYAKASSIIEDHLAHKYGCSSHGEVWQQKQMGKLVAMAQLLTKTDTSNAQIKKYGYTGLKELFVENHTKAKRGNPTKPSFDDIPKFHSKEAEKMGERELAEIDNAFAGTGKISLSRLNKVLASMDVDERITKESKYKDLLTAANTLRHAITDWKQANHTDHNSSIMHHFRNPKNSITK